MSSPAKRVPISPSQRGQRLDKVLSQAFPQMGRSAAKRLFAEGKVMVTDGQRRWLARKGAAAKEGTELLVQLTPADLDPAAEADPSVVLQLAFVSEHLVVVDKEATVPSAPLLPGEIGTVASGLVARFPEMASVGFGPREPGLCHRLDTGTSGLLVAARSKVAFETIREAISSERIDKRYLAICANTLPTTATIRLGLVPSGKRRVEAVPEGTAGARAALTEIKVISRHGPWALVEARAPRAYRHQVRVHLASMGAPIAGDQLYGGDPCLEGRHALHAHLIAWPGSAELPGFSLQSPLPEALQALLTAPEEAP